MKIEYYPDTMYGILLLNPDKLIEGIKISEYGTNRISFFPHGISLGVTKDKNTKRSPPYFKCKIDKRSWNKLQRSDFENIEKVLENIEAQTKDSPIYFKETTDMYEKKEIQTT